MLCFHRTVSDLEFLLQQMFHVQDHSLQKRISDGVYFSKITSLHCTECDSTIYRLYRIYFSDYVPEISCIKKNILRKESMVYQRLNKVAISRKGELTLDIVEEALKILMYLQESLLGTLFSVKRQV